MVWTRRAWRPNDRASLVVVVAALSLGPSRAALAQVQVLTTDQAVSPPNTIAPRGNVALNQAGDYAYSGQGPWRCFSSRAGSSSVVRVIQSGDPVPGIPHTRADIASSVFINSAGLVCFLVDYLEGGSARARS